MAGLAPADATKQSHKAIRDVCKTCVLGTNYGMQARSLAARTGLSVIEAQDLLRRLAQTFPTFTAWADHVADVGQLTGYLSTVFGWTLRTENTPRSTTLRNFPMQANGAEMLRLACCLATETGSSRLRARSRCRAHRGRCRPNPRHGGRPLGQRWPRRQGSCLTGSKSAPMWRLSSGPTGMPTTAAG